MPTSSTAFAAANPAAVSSPHVRSLSPARAATTRRRNFSSASFRRTELISLNYRHF